MPASVPQTGKNDCEEKKVVNGDNTDNRKMNAEVTARKKYKCPVCGYYTLDGFYGSYDICPVCFWEEDGLQFDEPLAWGGANGACLIRARINFHEFGAAEKRMLKNVRPPEPSELSGKDYKSPILWYAEEEDRLLLQTFSYNRSSLEELDWRADALHLKRTEIPWLTLDGDPDPTKWKQLPFREAIKKLSTYEMKRGMLYYLGPEDWSFLEKELRMNMDQVGSLNDDEARDLWNRLRDMAESDSPFHETAKEILQNVIRWAVPFWDIPEWMTEW